MTQPFSVVAVGATTARAMRHMTFPRFHTLLERVGRSQSVQALALLQGRKAIGLAILEMQADDLVLRSIFVHRAYRRRGGARTLLRHCRDRAEGRTLRVSYSVELGDERDAPVHRLFDAAGWTSPDLSSRTFCIEHTRCHEAPWYHIRPRLPDGLAVVPWQDVTGDPMARIGPVPWAADSLHPRHHVGVGADGAAHDVAASALLVDPGAPSARCKGWIMVHRLGPEDWRVSAGIVHPDLERKFVYFALVEHANTSIVTRGCKRGWFVVRPEEPRMMQFAQRRLTPVSSVVRTSWSRALGPEAV